MCRTKPGSAHAHTLNGSCCERHHHLLLLCVPAGPRGADRTLRCASLPPLLLKSKIVSTTCLCPLSSFMQVCLGLLVKAQWDRECKNWTQGSAGRTPELGGELFFFKSFNLYLIQQGKKNPSPQGLKAKSFLNVSQRQNYLWLKCVTLLMLTGFLL